MTFGCSLHVNHNEAFAEFSWNVRYYTVIRPVPSTMFCWGHRILPTQRVSDLRKEKLVDWLVIPRCHDCHDTAWKSSAFETGSILLNLCLVCWTIQICAKLRWTNWIKYIQILSSKLWHVFFVDCHGLPKGIQTSIYFATWHLPVVEAHPRIQPCRDWSEWLPQTNGRASHSKSSWAPWVKTSARLSIFVTSKLMLRVQSMAMSSAVSWCICGFPEQLQQMLTGNP